MVIYLDDYRKVKAARGDKLQERYGHELRGVNCNASVAGSATSAHPHAHELSPQLPEDSESIDVDAFLDRVYIFASRV